MHVSMRVAIDVSMQHAHGCPREGTLGDTLGQDSSGVVIVDQACNPMTHKGVGELASVVGTQEYRINVQLPTADGRGWKKEVCAVDTAACEELGPDFRQDLASGAKFLAKETHIKANDPHFDAKLWPPAHPHGTGSLLAETGSGGGVRNMARNRLALP